jgi:UPF0755 protein
MLWFLLSLFQPFAGGGEGRVRVLIPEGTGVARIGELLERRGVVSSSFFFRLRATVSGHRDDLKPGSYTLRRDMSYGAALDALAAGPARNVVELTIPEGKARREVASIVRRAGVQDSYLKASVRSRVLDPADYGAAGARSLEGFLFPSTYEVRRGAAARVLVGKQLTTFKREFSAVNLAYAKHKNLTPYDVLIIASLVEREAELDRERPLIASVIYNRLREHIPLGIDATIRYATRNWRRPLTQSELALNSPYNTRTHQGLPPTPIGSPGIASIRAAARPARSQYLYYVVKVCGNGAHVFTRTYAEFQRAQARYEAERRRRGGRSPATC